MIDQSHKQVLDACILPRKAGALRDLQTKLFLDGRIKSQDNIDSYIGMVELALAGKRMYNVGDNVVARSHTDDVHIRQAMRDISTVIAVQHELMEIFSSKFLPNLWECMDLLCWERIDDHKAAPNGKSAAQIASWEARLMKLHTRFYGLCRIPISRAAFLKWKQHALIILVAYIMEHLDADADSVVTGQLTLNQACWKDALDNNVDVKSQQILFSLMVVWSPTTCCNERDLFAAARQWKIRFKVHHEHMSDCILLKECGPKPEDVQYDNSAAALCHWIMLFTYEWVKCFGRRFGRRTICKAAGKLEKRRDDDGKSSGTKQAVRLNNFNTVAKLVKKCSDATRSGRTIQDFATLRSSALSKKSRAHDKYMKL